MSALYLLLIITCFIGAYLIAKKAAIRVDWKRFFVGLATVSLPFLLWDAYATKYGHWGFNPDYTFGFKIAGMPLSEILFFVAIPLYFVTVYEVALNKKPFSDAQKDISKKIFLVLRFAGIPLLTLLSVNSLQVEGRSYTFIVATVMALSLLLISYSLKYTSKAWALTNAYAYLAFIIFNTILTAVPVVTYSSFETLNYRIGTIPVEDFLYNFALVNLFLLAYTLRKKDPA